jgi:hypothetical protein
MEVLGQHARDLSGQQTLVYQKVKTTRPTCEATTNTSRLNTLLAYSILPILDVLGYQPVS